MTPYHESDGVVLYHGDCLQVLRTIPAESVDAVVSDPPYGLSFMGKRWDYDVPTVEVWAECLRVLKPGGHLLAFAGTRTQHRMAVRIEDAGFEIRDMIAWLYGSGFPKSLDVSKAIDSLDARQAQHQRRLRFTQWMRNHCPLTAAEANRIIGCDGEASHFFTDGEQPHIATRQHFELLRPYFTEAVPDEIEAMVEQRSVESENMKSREVLKSRTQRLSDASTWAQHATTGMFSAGDRTYNITAPATPEAQRWQGWGTALKPALEPITVARKPISGTVAETVLQHGTGALNVDGCRVGTDENLRRMQSSTAMFAAEDRPWKDRITLETRQELGSTAGRWPANLIHDGSDEVTGLFPETGGGAWPANGSKFGYAGGERKQRGERTEMADSGSAARFFYCAKASKRDRGETNKHPTVKPTALMRYLCKLVTPPGGLVLDPFTGSGSTGRGAVLEGFRFVGMELDAEHVAEAKRRILEVQNGWTDEPEDEPIEDLPGQRLLF